MTTQPGGLKVVAILAAYNEADIIGRTIEHLIAQGVTVYFMDHQSTDDTVQQVEPYLGKGVLHIEHFVEESNGPGDQAHFAWEQILRRKELLAQELDADWFIHQDADEFRESPWAERTLVDAIRLVDRFGYNAIDFEVLHFRPTRELRPGEDVRQAFTSYQPPRPFDALQIRCWKKTGASVDLVSSGGHEARFDGRRVFPIRFMLHHYPIRGQEHGARKVFVDRRPRLLPDEHQRGWHIQYDDIESGHDFLHRPEALVRYDADAVRLQLVLRHRDVEDAEARRCEAEHRLIQVEAEHTLEAGRLADVLAERTQEADSLRAQIEVGRGEADALGAQMQVVLREAERLSADLTAARAAADEKEAEALRLSKDLEKTRQEVNARVAEAADANRYVSELLRSLSWRITAPLRAAGRLLTRRSDTSKT